MKASVARFDHRRAEWPGSCTTSAAIDGARKAGALRAVLASRGLSEAFRAAWRLARPLKFVRDIRLVVRSPVIVPVCAMVTTRFQ